ncbi:MAG: hypothetical protein ACXWYM_00440 [Candidatus Binatia bacterium]
MSKLIIKDGNGRIVQTIENGKITDYRNDFRYGSKEHGDWLTRFCGLDDAQYQAEPAKAKGGA